MNVQCCDLCNTSSTSYQKDNVCNIVSSYTHILISGTLITFIDKGLSTGGRPYGIVWRAVPKNSVQPSRETASERYKKYNFQM